MLPRDFVRLQIGFLNKNERFFQVLRSIDQSLKSFSRQVCWTNESLFGMTRDFLQRKHSP